VKQDVKLSKREARSEDVSGRVKQDVKMSQQGWSKTWRWVNKG